MKKRLLIICLLTFTLVGCSTSALTTLHENRELTIVEKKHPPNHFRPKNFSFVQIGDSLTEGVGDINQVGGYTSYLKDLLENNRGINEAIFQNFGVKGNRSDQLLSRIKTQAEIQEAIEQMDVAIITIGGNDVMATFRKNMLDLQVEKFKSAELGYSSTLEEILTEVRRNNPNIYIILVGIYNPFSKWFTNIYEMEEIAASWNEQSVSILHQYDRTTFVPIAQIFENHYEDLLHTDFFHPNNKGYELIANQIYTYIQTEHILKQIRE